MAFDQSTRNRLQKFVSEACGILSEEFTRQLQATYGLDPKSGTVADVSSLTHLDNRQRQTAHILRETLAHYVAGTPGKGKKDRTRQSLDRIVREQAFTVLNRLAALRMAEARGFLLESIAKGYSSKGFQLYKQLAGSALGETGDAYRNYLFSLFDEFSLDLAVLFDRHSAQGLLFPRESALLELLEQINHHEIEHLWAEDETIGWIYQYFNSQEERKKMRAESQAPRNSRELAVRNQFFTPRYVVEFLTDNTLGRIWYEMTQGDTGLTESCRYLVRRPTEIFLKQGEQSSEQALEQTSDDEQAHLSQEELLKQPVYIPFRQLKDPRSIRMLDPACGSMHFGLYAFDLFERIYLEAWQLETQRGPDAFVREDGQQPLQTTFESFEAFKVQIPKLIIEHNIHGVDIDPRAVQIAGLSLWQRAQRAWHQLGVKPQQRPQIKKSNIVCAEPMPGEKALLQEFTSKLNPPVLGQLLEVIFDKMQLAGEAGTLLKIEEEIQTAIAEAREQWQQQSGKNSMADMFQAEKDAATPQQNLGFDLRGIDDETFWDNAEHRILEALSDYADQAESNANQKRLFAEDAAKGFAFIDLCRKRFDVVLMNPPFGEPSINTANYISKRYLEWSKNILCAFIERYSHCIAQNGYVATVIDRSPLNKSSYSSFREKVLINNDALEVVLDLGWGVLDANVEVSSLVLSGRDNSNNNTLFIDVRQSSLEEKDSQIKNILNDSNNIFSHKTESFGNFPNSALVYELPDELLNLFSLYKNYSSQGYVGYTGHQLQSERHFRLFWEVAKEVHIGKNQAFAKLYNGGEFNRYSNPKREIVRFGKYSSIGSENFPSYSYRIQNKDKHFKNGVGFGVRGDVLDAHPIDDETLFTVEGQCIPVADENTQYAVLGILNSQLTSTLLNTYSGQHKYSGYINLLPLPSLKGHTPLEKLVKNVQEIIAIKSRYYQFDETTFEFTKPYLQEAIEHGWTYDISIKNIIDSIKVDNAKLSKLHSENNSLVLCFYKITDKSSIRYIHSDSSKSPIECVPKWGRMDKDEIKKGITFDFLNYIVGIVFDQNIVAGHNSPIIPEDPTNTNGLSNLVSKELTGISSDDLQNGLGIAAGKSAFSKYFSRSNGFFEFHLNKYTCSRRPSPIYWPLQTPSGSYTLWVYYHRLNEQTLYTCVNDFVEPKLKSVTDDLNTLRNQSARSSQEEKELARLTGLETELKDFRDELLRIAKFWKPNLNDGVQITAAPLWKLFQHKAWQKKLKQTWEKLEKGDYDWAHLACNIWPDRVLRKCHQDRSLAIAHDVEDIFWHEVEVPVVRRGKDTGETKLEWQPKDLTDTELTELVNQTITGMK